MAKLTTARRHALPRAAFGQPATRAYPIMDKSHARNALARVSQFGSRADNAALRAKVKKRFPTIDQHAHAQAAHDAMRGR